MQATEYLICSVPPGQPSVFWKGANSDRYYRRRNKADRDSGTDQYYLVKKQRKFNLRPALVALAVLVLLWFAYSYLSKN
jgi:hypothetical protein